MSCFLFHYNSLDYNQETKQDSQDMLCSFCSTHCKTSVLPLRHGINWKGLRGIRWGRRVSLPPESTSFKRIETSNETMMMNPLSEGGSRKRRPSIVPTNVPGTVDTEDWVYSAKDVTVTCTKQSIPASLPESSKGRLLPTFLISPSKQLKSTNISLNL